VLGYVAKFVEQVVEKLYPCLHNQGALIRKIYEKVRRVRGERGVLKTYLSSEPQKREVRVSSVKVVERR
jgi:hypothetical protein